MDARALFAKGVALREQGQWAEAIAAYQECLVLDPDMGGAWFALGCAYYENGMNSCEQCEASYESLSRCIALDPSHAQAHYNLGIILQNVRRDFAGAEEMYRKAIKLDPSCAPAYSNLGTLLQNVRRDYVGAEKMYRKAIELDPSNALAHNNLGVLLNDVRRDYAGAEKVYRKAIELDPSNAPACWNLSSSLENQRDIPGAIEFIEKYIQAGNPENDGEQRLTSLRAKLP